VTLAALGCVITAFAVPAQAFEVPTPPWAICSSAAQAAMSALEAHLSPANGVTIQAGTPVTFSGEFSQALTFNVASSPTLLSTPDIDSGPGSAQPQPSGSPLYTFTSTKAAATPGTIYWDASFSDAGLKGCEGQAPITYTTQARTLMVLPAPSPPTTAVTPATTPATPPAVTGSVSLAGSIITVQSSGEAALKLTCTGTGTCSGKLTLTDRSTPKKDKKAKTETIGTATFSIASAKTATTEVRLNALGRSLLGHNHGRLSASLTVLKSAPAPSQTHTDNVHLA
jgi:hypothetical protein